MILVEVYRLYCKRNYCSLTKFGKKRYWIKALQPCLKSHPLWGNPVGQMFHDEEDDMVNKNQAISDINIIKKVKFLKSLFDILNII